MDPPSLTLSLQGNTDERVQLALDELKGRAWLDLGERQAKGAPIDTKNIRKHANNVLRLSQLLAPDTRIPVAERIAQACGLSQRCEM